MLWSIIINNKSNFFDKSMKNSTYVIVYIFIIFFYFLLKLTLKFSKDFSLGNTLTCTHAFLCNLWLHLGVQEYTVNRYAQHSQHLKINTAAAYGECEILFLVLHVVTHAKNMQ